MNKSFFPLVNIQSELFAIRLNVGSLYVVIMQIGKGSIHAGLTFYLFGLQNLDQCHGFVCPPINAHITTTRHAPDHSQYRLQCPAKHKIRRFDHYLLFTKTKTSLQDHTKNVCNSSITKRVVRKSY